MTLEQDAENVAAAELDLKDAIAKAEADVAAAEAERTASAAEKVPTYQEYLTVEPAPADVPVYREHGRQGADSGSRV
jgi:hypothetical protein